MPLFLFELRARACLGTPLVRYAIRLAGENNMAYAVQTPHGWAAPASDERNTLEPASAAEIFRISRRLRSPTVRIAIWGPLPRRTWKATQHHTSCAEKGTRRTIDQMAANAQRAAPALIGSFSS